MKHNKFWIFLFLFTFIGISFSCQQKFDSSLANVEDLTCEYLDNPLGIDKTAPRLSWQIQANDMTGEKQTAYQIIVASSLKNLSEGKADLWNTGKVNSGQSILLEYDGKTLGSQMHCYWKVRVWDKDDKASKWSESAMWSMGLLEEKDWQAKWIGSPDSTTSPYYRNSFEIDDLPEQANIFIASLGYYELYVNGQKIGTEVLAPAVSNFSKRSYYQTHEVSSYLKKGLNSIGIWMGTGWYTPGLPGVTHYSPVVRAQLELSDRGKRQTIISDNSWETKASERKRLGTWAWGNFGGEQVDARNIDEHWWQTDKSTEGWASVVEAEVADVPCSAQSCRGNVGFDTLRPQTIEMLDEETVLVDFGTNLTGMMQMTFQNLNPGQKISMFYGDLDGRPEDERWRVSMAKKNFAVYNQWDEFISAGAEEEHFENVFNYHAFRYVLIEGLNYMPDKVDLAAVCIETEAPETGSFSCSNELYNDIHKMVSWTYRCLNLGGQTVDCPQRERLGYGDGQTIMDLGLFNYDAISLYTKWSQNWWDEQTDDGFVPFTAPCPHGTGGGPAWGAMCIQVPWKTYLFSNDLNLLTEGYPYMKKYIEYLNSHSEDGLLQDIFQGDKWKNLGDWVPPRRGMDKQDWVEDNSRIFFNNCYRVHLLQIMEDIASILGHNEDVKTFEQQISESQKAIHDAWFNPADNTYANGEQPYLIFPLKTGITPDHLKDKVFEKYVETLLVKDQGHLNTGMIGTQIMTDYLVEIDRNDLIDVFVNKKTFPGWGYMIEKGATTCWEQWNGYYSQIHSCFPFIGGWFYKGLAGIQWDANDPGFKNVILRPGLVPSVDWVNCSYESPYGEIISNWKIENDHFEWEITIPANSTATVHIPGENIKKDGQKESHTVFELESGKYLFTSNIEPRVLN